MKILEITMDYQRRCWAEIDLDALERNYHALREKLRPETEAMAVVKANAYGHGDVEIARCLEELGVRRFAVACLDEALSLRRSGCRGEILLLGPTPDSLLDILIENDFIQTIHSAEYAESLKRGGKALKVQLKIDSGMHRIGFDSESPEEMAAAADVYRSFTCLGTFTHFSSADDASEESLAYTRRQFARFQRACALLEAEGISLGLRHCDATAALLAYPETQLDMVRMGIGLYGLAPSADVAKKAKLSPVMSLRARISHVHTLPAGEGLGYGRSYIATEPREIATVPVGYADGYSRKFSNRAHMLVRGEEAPVVGRICMDYSMVDITKIPGIRPGDVITLAGRDGDREISFEEWGLWSESLHYERVCAIAARVPRVYLRQGECAAVRDYLTR